MIARRGFLAGMLAAAAAPAIVRSQSLMKIVVPSDEILLPEWLESPFYDNHEHALDAMRYQYEGLFLRGDGTWAKPPRIIVPGLTTDGREVMRFR